MGELGFWGILSDILVLLLAALVLGVLCERFRQSPILGYLAAGALLGPNAFQVISNADEVSLLAELGVALLLFTIGLEFSWKRLRMMGSATLGAGAAQVLVTLALAALASLLGGVSIRVGLALGAMVALSSTALVLRILISRTEIESSHGRQALGILLVQDIAVVPLVLLVTVLGGEGSAWQVILGTLQTLGAVVAMLLVSGLLFNKVIPRVLHLQTLQHNRDLPILLAIVTGLGSAWGSHKLGLSPALGAFVAGMLLAESPFATQIRADIASVRTLLVTLFFCTIGMLGDPPWVAQHLPRVLLLVVTIVTGKALLIWLILRLFGQPHSTALAAGLCLGQVGEFSFVLAEVGRESLLGEELFHLMISTTIVTLFLTPHLVALAPRVSRSVVQRLRRLDLVSVPPAAATSALPPDHVIIIGFGPAGQTVAQAIEHHASARTVIDLDPRMVSMAGQMTCRGYVGDATHADVLEHAGILSASLAVVTIPDPAAALATIERIRSIAPDVHVVARARYHSFLASILGGGAHEVVDEEREVGTRLAARVRRQLRINGAAQMGE